MKLCVNCGNPVSQGDRHAKLSCPPAKKGLNSRARRKRAARKRNRFNDLPIRGVTVAGTGVPKGASKG